MNVFCIDLQAVDPSHNRRRFYRIEAGQDLLGAWVIRLQYGRIGTQGRIRRSRRRRARRPLHRARVPSTSAFRTPTHRRTLSSARTVRPAALDDARQRGMIS